MLFEIIKWLIYYCCYRIFYRVEKIGYENIPETGAFIMCANHTSNWDVPTLLLTVKRKLRFMAKESMFHIFFIGKIVKMSGAFPVKRETNDIGAVKKALSLLKQGEAVGMFPEATRVRAGKQVDSVKAGVVMLAVKGKVPIIPVGIDATFKPFSKVKVRVGKPIVLEEYFDQKLQSEALSEIAERIFDEVRALTVK